MSEETTIGDLVANGSIELGDGYRTKQAELSVDGFRIIRAADVKGGQIALDGRDFVAHHYSRHIGGKQAKPGDVLLTTKGTVGRVAIVPDGIEPAVYSPQLCWFRVQRPDVLNGRYLGYWLQSPEFLRQASYLQGNTDMAPYISLSDLRSSVTHLPPLPEQQAIAEVLGALDDKIAANTKLAATADELVRTEYQSLQDVDLVRVSDIATSPRIGVDPSAVDPSTSYVGLEHIPRRMMWLSDTGTAADVSSGKSQFAEGDVLFGKLRPYFHKVASAATSGICSTDVLVVRAKESYTSSVLLAAVSSDAVVSEVVSASVGTRMPRTSWKDLGSVKIPWPTSESLPRLTARLDAIRVATLAALAENRTLAATRDALLPQLMSGKLRVRDAEAVASGALR